jgi:hypothetical protein
MLRYALRFRISNADVPHHCHCETRTGVGDVTWRRKGPNQQQEIPLAPHGLDTPQRVTVRALCF